MKKANKIILLICLVISITIISSKDGYVKKPSRLESAISGLSGLSIIISAYRWLLQDIPSIYPVLKSPLGRGYIVSYFGWRKDPFTNKLVEHNGIDIANLVGTPVIATAQGIVKDVGRDNNGLGIYVVITHKYGFSTHYHHLSQAFVKPGDFVKKGEKISILANTGLEPGPHVHYEVRINDIPINPYLFTRLDMFYGWN
ncbi:MAG: hypothetical protein IEMM0008_1146 [bacterium]|nr:MAG: hypothetical protein IEMM0008_1146 [bacterium]